MKRYLFIICYLFSIGLNAQECEWLNIHAGNQNNRVNSSSIDLNDDIIVVGEFNSNLIIDTFSFSGSGSISGYICKYDKLGKLIWVHITYGFVRFTDVISDENNNIYAVGLFRDSVTFSNNISLKHPSSKTHNALFISKFDSNGICLWAKRIYQANSMGEQVSKITLDASNNPIMSFSYANNNVQVSDSVLSFVPSVFNTGIVKYDTAGNVLWLKGIAPITQVRIQSDEFNNIYVSCFLWGDSVLVFGSDTLTGRGHILLKFNNSGNPLRAIRVDNQTNPQLAVQSNSLFIKNNNIILLNQNNQSVWVQNQYVSNPNNSRLFYIAFFDTSLNLIRLRQPDSTSNSVVSVTAGTSSKNEIYFGGRMFSGNLKLENTTLNTSTNTSSFFIAKMDTLGNLLWAFNNQGSSSQSGLFSLSCDSRNDVYIGGNFNDSISIFNKSESTTSTTFPDGFLAKITDYSITRGEVFAGPYCAGDSMDIPFTIRGTYDLGNRFIAQLSDENGNFDDTAKIRTLGFIESTEDSVIRGKLPLFEVSSSGNYRIRVISTNPPVQSFFQRDSLRLLIYSRDKAEPGPDETICLGDSFQLNTFGGTAWQWTPAINMDDSTLRQPIVWPSTNTTYRIVISDSSG
jgi:hypothetical protein